MKSFWARATVLLGTACSGEDVVAAGRMRLAFGLESAPWTDRSAEVRISRELADGRVEEHATLSAPRQTFALGTSTEAMAFGLDVVDANGSVVARGKSLPIVPRDAVGVTLPLFVSKRDSMARACRFASAIDAPLPFIVADRFVFAAGLIDGALEAAVYDLSVWSEVSATSLPCPGHPCAVSSVAVVGDDRNLTLLVGGGGATWVDLGTTTTGTAEAPEGFSFDEVQGGQTFGAPGGEQFLIGATREGAPTDAVLAVAVDGTLTALRLGERREGAAAAWLDGVGVVVAGGGSGVEVLRPDASTFETLPFPPDATRGAALAMRDGEVLRVGGDGDTVRLDLECTSSCAPEPRSPSIGLARARAFVDSSGRVVVVGDEGGLGRVQLLDGDVLELAEPRHGGRALQLPTGHVALVGGFGASGARAETLELLAP